MLLLLHFWFECDSTMSPLSSALWLMILLQIYCILRIHSLVSKSTYSFLLVFRSDFLSIFLAKKKQPIQEVPLLSHVSRLTSHVSTSRRLNKYSISM